MQNNFFKNYRDVAGIVYGPLFGEAPSFGNSQFNNRTPKPIKIDWGAQNSGIDKEKVESRKKYTKDTIELKDNGIKPLVASDLPPIATIPEKILWRLDGRQADTNRYNELLSSIKNELSNSKSYEETAKILNKYAKSWDMNMYILGTEENRRNGFYDWSVANFFGDKLDNYNKWKDLPETPSEYPNEEWIQELIEGIDNSLTLDKRVYIPAERIKLT